PVAAVLLMPGRDLIVDLAGADGVTPVHQPAAPAREAETMQPHHVDVAGADRLAFLEDLAGLVDRGEQKSMQNFLVAERALLYALLGCNFLDQTRDFRVRDRRAIARLVAVPSSTRLEALAAGFDEAVRDRELAEVGVGCGAPLARIVA